MDKELEKKLVESCSEIIERILDKNVLTVETNEQRVDRLTIELVKKCIRVYEEETGALPFSSDAVMVSFPIDELKDVKNSILSACAPRVTFNDDIEVMKDERDISRRVSLDELELWINRALK